jgi:hypothetical protein
MAKFRIDVGLHYVQHCGSSGHLLVSESAQEASQKEQEGLVSIIGLVFDFGLSGCGTASFA